MWLAARATLPSISWPAHKDLDPSVIVYDMTPEMLEAEPKAKAYDRNILKGIEWQCGMAEKFVF